MLRKPGAVITTIGIAGALLAGCGANQPGLAAPSRSHSSVRAYKLATKKVAKARLTRGPNEEESTTGAKPLNPCKLVTLAEARAITREPITKVTEAPLGPTCIYSRTGHAAAITLAVDAERLIQVARNMRARKPVVI
ncbi:MAG: hypothetical protein JO213_10080, partial [Alphaproteobacteria bacterium]|nr:hypothetical protein [Alphaproteobacteria bacterium]